ncbi:type II secretion system protein GspM [Duganella sp. Dugasp56]|uniref:type II secretion system protein GspM n=1 Tax=Duganella sp. Dugasp56 TaxID=3243046 RepID=UPI0039AF72F4
MKQRLLLQWIKLSTKLDSMTLRERAMVFLAVVAAILFLVYTVTVEPLLVRQRLLQTQIKQQQNQISGIDIEISVKAQAYAADPDAPARERLKSLDQEIEHTRSGLLSMQKGLVAPEKIAPLLEQLLRGNGKLRLMSMKTLPATGLMEVAQAPSTSKPAAANPASAAGAAVVSAPPAPAGAPTVSPVKPHELLYRHGVEIVLQGSYLDMVNYMDELERLPVQLFWGKASLDAQQYPNSRLTLTLYTLSLDSKWMKL